MGGFEVLNINRKVWVNWVKNINLGKTRCHPKVKSKSGISSRNEYIQPASEEDEESSCRYLWSNI